MDCFMAECSFYNTNVWRKEEICKVLVCFMFLVGMILPTFPFPVSSIVLLQNIAFFGAKHFFLLGGNIAFFGEGRTEAVGTSSFAQLKGPV